MKMETQINQIKEQIEQTKMEIERDIEAKYLNNMPKDIIRECIQNQFNSSDLLCWNILKNFRIKFDNREER